VFIGMPEWSKGKNTPWDEFDAYAKDHPYKSFLPEDAKPPLDLNEELMNKWRPLMEKFYIEN
jgi:hypothetical protein